jgi:hypothetical protein
MNKLLFLILIILIFILIIKFNCVNKTFASFSFPNIFKSFNSVPISPVSEHFSSKTNIYDNILSDNLLSDNILTERYSMSENTRNAIETAYKSVSL